MGQLTPVTADPIPQQLEALPIGPMRMAAPTVDPTAAPSVPDAFTTTQSA